MGHGYVDSDSCFIIGLSDKDFVRVKDLCTVPLNMMSHPPDLFIYAVSW